MASCCREISSIIRILVIFLLVSCSICPVLSSEPHNLGGRNQTFRPEKELKKLKIVRQRLDEINKPADPPERPRAYETEGNVAGAEEEQEHVQLWRMSGETCPEGTIPVRRTREEDMLRASSVRRFGRKPRRRVRRDSTSNGHENDAYETTGCYNLLCSGFVQTNNRIAIGAAISPMSSYHGGQFDITLLVWKDPKHGNWWLEFGSGVLVGYWPSCLFTHLRDHATMVQFGGEIVNSRAGGFHTSTAMGSGHFSGEGFGKASYFRNLQVVDWDNNLIPLPNLRLLADHPNCYDIRGGINGVWGHYFYYGGPGRNVRCP
ncbi:hypothetical protein V6N11_010263 [Hibiscus sabdariffa]|uniref:Neprosin PEP catalytic domain-containing protein n=1 Tax=Hibiscus sabdariffa TaxID=183260 RepID=A0ABR2PE41_9ROSI